MVEFFRDLRFGFRLLKKSPLFAFAAVLLLAIGISGNTLIFSLMNALLLRDLPVEHPQNLVRLVEIHPNDFVTWDFPYDFGDALQQADPNLAEVLSQGETDVAFSDGSNTERIRVHLVSPNFFSSLGAHAYLGRVLTQEDEHARASNAVLSYDFWTRRFHGDGSVVGRKVLLAGRPFTVVGVTAEGFNGLAADTSPDLRVPASSDQLLLERPRDLAATARPLFGEIFARVRDGVALDQASNEVNSLAFQAYTGAMNRIFPFDAGDGRNSKLQFEPVAKGVSMLRAQFSRGLEVLMAGSALLLLMACANVAGLLLARSVARAREIDIRLALGAGPFRLARQLFTEGLILAVLGGVAGTALTAMCLPALAGELPPIRDRAAVLQPLRMQVGIDLRVLGFTLTITILTAVLFSLTPALRAARQALAGTLRSGRASTSRVAPWNLVVIGQVALCTLILVGAALLLDTLQRLRSLDPGFDRDHVVTFTVDPSLRRYTKAQSQALGKLLLEKAAALRGVVSASLASRPLMRGTGVKATLAPAGTRVTPADFLNSSLNDVTPEYFDTMGIRLLSGRNFTWFDRSQKPRLVVVNQTLARRFFPGRNPIGQRIGYAGKDGLGKADNEIIGVVSDAKYRSLREPVPATVYSPAVDGFASTFVLHVRTHQAPDALIEPVREAMRAIDPEMPFIEVHTLRQEVDASLWQERLLAALSGIFSAIAGLVAAVGLFGLIDYTVKSRTPEIGVRKALGAESSAILALLSNEFTVLIVAGIAAGMGVYAVAARWIRSVLFGVTPWDPPAVAATVTLVLAIAALSIAPAAYRALRIDPAAALRSE